jgi:hypothetical protein
MTKKVLVFFLLYLEQLVLLKVADNLNDNLQLLHQRHEALSKKKN